MRIHHLNCGTLHPLGGLAPPGRFVCHCLLVECADRLVLVDSGIGHRDRIEHRLGRMFEWVMRPTFDPAETAVEQIRALGYDPKDVRDVVLTHLDLDHAGGLSDLPHARVHLHARELEAATHPPTFLETERYKPIQWAHAPKFVTYEATGEPWNGFAAVRALDDLPPELLLVPLFGHSRGHTGVVVVGEGKPLMHCGDAYFHVGDVDADVKSPALVRIFRDTVPALPEDERANRARIGELRKGGQVDTISAHAASEFTPAG